ncbi:aryl-alcohol dehydrogenase-like predicted oxidoreductase [Arthrobacter sp. UYCo732]
MEYIKLGNTGMDISPLALGCMTFGDPDRGPHPWTLPEDQSRPLIRQAVEAGINFFDTANVYSHGSSEEIMGRALADFTHREETVIATKVHGVMRPGPNGRGLSRKAIFAELDASLTRLATDYVDLYQIHRWDPATPVEETLEALHDVVKAGKVRYIGASSMAAWQFSKALYLQQLNGWTRFVTMQDHYNLVYREEEREMFPLCADQKIGVLPWSPLARGSSHGTGTRKPTARRRTSSARRSTPPRKATGRSPKPCASSPNAAECPAPRSPWPGSAPTASSVHRLSARASRPTSRTPSPPWN